MTHCQHAACLGHMATMPQGHHATWPPREMATTPNGHRAGARAGRNSIRPTAPPHRINGYRSGAACQLHSVVLLLSSPCSHYSDVPDVHTVVCSTACRPAAAPLTKAMGPTGAGANYMVLVQHPARYLNHMLQAQHATHSTQHELHKLSHQPPHTGAVQPRYAPKQQCNAHSRERPHGRQPQRCRQPLLLLLRQRVLDAGDDQRR